MVLVRMAGWMASRIAASINDRRSMMWSIILLHLSTTSVLAGVPESVREELSVIEHLSASLHAKVSPAFCEIQNDVEVQHSRAAERVWCS